MSDPKTPKSETPPKSTIPKWAQGEGQAILDMRPVEGQFEPGFDRMDPDLRRSLLLWWDTWVRPHAQALADGTFACPHLGYSHPSGKREVRA